MSPLRTSSGILLLLTLVLAPTSSHAQNRDAFVARLVELTNALGGAFGDEGADATRALDALEEALAAWDASIARAERGFAADLPTAPGNVAPQMLGAIGSLYVQRGRLAEGIRQLKAALALPGATPRGPLVQLLAAAQRASGRDADAAEALRAEWARAPGDALLAALVTETGTVSPEDSARAVDAVVAGVLQGDVSGPSAPFVSLALVEGGSGEPVFPPARYAPAFAMLLANDLAGGVRALRDAMTGDPLVAGAAAQPESMWKGIAALRAGNLADGIAHLRNAVTAAAGSPETHRALATAYWADGRLAEAAAEFAAAIDLNPSDDRAHVALADVVREDGDDEQVQQVVARGIAAVPASGQLHWTLARLKERDHADADAIAAYRHAAQAGAPFAGAGLIHAALGRLHHAQLDLETATADYERRVRLDPNSATGHQALGEVLQARDLHERAVVELLVAHLLDPRQSASLAAAAQSLLALDRNGDAERAARRALALDADNVQARYTLAVVLPRLGRTEEGQQELDAYRRLQARMVEAQRRGMEMNGFKLQAQVLSASGDHAAAATAWRQAIALEGPAPETLAQLARELAAAGQTDEAVAAYSEALRRRPDVAVQRQLVTLLEKLGRADAAAARDTYERMKRQRLQQRGAVR